MYKRVLLKLSGEALSSPEAAFYSRNLKKISKRIKRSSKIGSRTCNRCRWWQLHSWQNDG